jgi:phage host-nuclease inhibitor protein Gam
MPKTEIEKFADTVLAQIRDRKRQIDELEIEAEEVIKTTTEMYQQSLAPLKKDLDALEKLLIKTMRKDKRTLFADRDIVQLDNGNLLYSKGPKVTIPRDALDKCEENKFNEAIKIAKSLDRAIVESWPDEKLFLIGAERKPAETFNYELKKEKDEQKKTEEKN